MSSFAVWCCTDPKGSFLCSPNDNQNERTMCQSISLVLAVILDLAVFITIIWGLAGGWQSGAPGFFTQSIPNTISPLGTGAILAAIPLLLVIGLLTRRLLNDDSQRSPSSPPNFEEF